MSLNYLVVRLAQILPTFLLIMLVAFVLVRLLPGDPTSAILGLKATDADVVRLNAQYGLDKPIPVQFLFFLRNFFQGNLGESIILKVPVHQPDPAAPAGDAAAQRVSPACSP